MKKILLTLALFVTYVANATKVDLTEQRWSMWLDYNAEYFSDVLYLPPYQIDRIESRAPSCGWAKLYEQRDAYKITLPATVEQYAWGANGHDHGIAGDYLGVSWFSTQINGDSAWQGKRVVLHFESVRLRAEIYLNGELVGYELVNGLPFTVDISSHIKLGESNRLDVRITDPNGNYAWRDWDSFMWGDYEVPPSHGFGGITGGVTLEVTDRSYIEDLYIQNLDTKGYNKINTEVTLCNQGTEQGGKLRYTLYEASGEKALVSKSVDVAPFSGSSVVKLPITYKDAKLWSPDSPSLYRLSVDWTTESGDEHNLCDRFGFRWFSVEDVEGDRMFMLNGKRIILHTAISWGHWPENGLFPTEEYARKQVESAKALGMNMLNCHRGLGQKILFDVADEMGLLIYEEPGGYRPGTTDFALKWKQNKLLRMVKRDRNHPSLVIFNMINESARDPFENEIEDIQLAHQIDPSRIITFTSTFFPKKLYDGECPTTPAAVKMHMLPFDAEVHYQGWWDKHNAGGPGVYQDHFYQSKRKFQRYKEESDEIIFYGEEGAIGTPPRLELIKREVEKSGNSGWNGADMVRQYEAFDNFITQRGFRDAFPSVDDLCLSLGAVSYYYQGRMMENVRISNNIDGWATNGWESTKVENHSGVVDLYRNLKADPQIIARYNQPHYIAVKATKKVLRCGENSMVDLYMVNQVNLKGRYTLRVSLENPETGERSQTQEFSVTLKGGTTYGELLVERVEIEAEHLGYNNIKAELLKSGEVISTGCDELFATELNGVSSKLFVADTTGVSQNMLKRAGIEFKECGIGEVVKHEGATLLIGAQTQPRVILGNFRQDDPLIDWVLRGGKLIITQNAAEWCEYLEDKEVVDYRGNQILDRNWFGGNFFVGSHPLFSGLPNATAFNWEYQSLSAYSAHREGLRIESGECVVGCYADHQNELFSALSTLKVGKGEILITTLDLERGAGNAVVDKLLENIVNF